jgi:S1-C subfamily serine protease
VLTAGGGAVWWSRVRAAAPERIAASASRSVYLVALDGQNGRRSVGTAFAVSDGVLATNAHVADALGAALSAQGSALQALAVRSDGFDTHAVVAARFHPEWRPGSIAHDVALLQLADGSRTVPLELAEAGQVRTLTRGAAVSAFGFPAVSTDPQRPRGRLSVDVLSDVRLPFLEVGLGIAPGTSGSPVFGPDGRVVGLVVSGDFEKGADGVPPHPTGSNVNWAISVDELRTLLSVAGGSSTP